jgi:hypothetical protein
MTASLTEPNTKYFRAAAVVATVRHQRERAEATDQHAEHHEQHVAGAG